jgi:hypothetical protein
MLFSHPQSWCLPSPAALAGLMLLLLRGSLWCLPALQRQWRVCSRSQQRTAGCCPRRMQHTRQTQ